MILALDTYYRENMAKTVGIAFHWNDLEPRQVYTAIHEPVKPYISPPLAPVSDGCRIE